MRCLSNLTRSLTRPLPFWLALPSLFACGTDSLKPEVPAEPTDVYWRLALDHQAVTMGPRPPYDTLTIHAVPRNVAGQVLAGLPTPTYVSRDVTKVTVSPEGLVHVSGGGFDPVWVVATMVTGNVRRADSLRVRSVDVDPPPVLGALSIHPVPPDSAKRAYGMDGQLPVQAVDANDVPMTDLMVSFRSLNPDVATVDEATGATHPSGLGNVTFTASTTMFGVTKVDTLPYRIGWPLSAIVNLPETGSSADTLLARIGVGGLVLLKGPTHGLKVEPFNVDFDDADLPNVREATASIAFDALGWSGLCQFFQLDCTGSGNVAATVPPNGAIRAFTAPGTYYYHASPSGIIGRIDAVDER